MKTGAKLAAILPLMVLGLTGCNGYVNAAANPYTPKPVVENGMTLDWRQDVKRQALEMIENSRRYCYLDIYELSDEDILNALETAKNRGVDVRVVVDATEKHSQRDAVPELRHRGVPVAALRIHRGISHIKMLLTDGKNGGVLIGGMNFGAHSWNNNDASVYIADPNPSFMALFHWDWLRAQGRPAAAPGYQLPLLSDRQIREQVVKAIESAKKRIYMEAFDLSDWQVLTDLKSAAERGVVVEVLLDPGQSLNRKAAVELRDAGVTVRFYDPYSGEWMHAKILDVDEGQTFIIGSANFSHQAFTYNHEGDIELHHVRRFDQSLQKDLSIEIARGTDYPVDTQHTAKTP